MTSNATNDSTTSSEQPTSPGRSEVYRFDFESDQQFCQRICPDFKEVITKTVPVRDGARPSSFGFTWSLAIVALAVVVIWYYERHRRELTALLKRWEAERQQQTTRFESDDQPPFPPSGSSAVTDTMIEKKPVRRRRTNGTRITPTSL